MSSLRILTATLCLTACAAGVDHPAHVPTSGLRVALPTVHFNKWTDFLTLQAGLSHDCVFLDPLVDDDSTNWPPLQVFWVIYDDESDVKDGRVVHDTFFLGDVVGVDDFPVLDGAAAVGFKFLPPSQRALLDIESIAVSADGRRLDAVLGSPLDTRLVVETAESDAGCSVRTEWCPSDSDRCELRPLTSIDVELTRLNFVRDIVWNE